MYALAYTIPVAPT